MVVSEPGSKVNSTSKGPMIVIEAGSFGWLPDQAALSDINISVERGSLTMAVGPIGSGKSSLCKALLGEIPHCHEKVTINMRSS